MRESRYLLEDESNSENKKIKNLKENDTFYFKCTDGKIMQGEIHGILIEEEFGITFITDIYNFFIPNGSLEKEFFIGNENTVFSTDYRQFCENKGYLIIRNRYTLSNTRYNSEIKINFFGNNREDIRKQIIEFLENENENCLSDIDAFKDIDVERIGDG